MESPLNKKYDYILASGVFTYSNNGFFQKCLELLYSKCNKGIAFNLLADIEKYKNETTQMEFLSNPDDILKFCKSLSPKVILKTTTIIEILVYICIKMKISINQPAYLPWLELF